jgi:hypothetical protein
MMNNTKIAILTFALSCCALQAQASYSACSEVIKAGGSTFPLTSITMFEGKVSDNASQAPASSTKERMYEGERLTVNYAFRSRDDMTFVCAYAGTQAVETYHVPVQSTACTVKTRRERSAQFDNKLVIAHNSIQCKY